MDYFLAIYLFIHLIKNGFSESAIGNFYNDAALSKSDSGDTIVPYSLYKRRLEAEQRRNSLLQSNATLWGNKISSAENKWIDSNQTIKIYLPPYSEEIKSNAAETNSEPLLFSTQKPTKTILEGGKIINDADLITPTQIQEEAKRRSYLLSASSLAPEINNGLTYSTGATREAVQKSIFRPQTRTILAKKPLNGENNWPNTQISSAENSLITRPSSMFQPNPPPRHYNRLGAPFNQLASSAGASNLGKYQPTYSRIVPAPYSTLSSQSASQNSNQNIVDDIFSQSQIRHAPQSLAPGFAGLAPLSGSPFGAPIIPQFGEAGGGAAAAPGQALLNGLGAINPLELLGQGSTLEQISKIAKNLLAMSSNGGGGNSELFSAVSKVIGAGPVDAGSKLTSRAVLQPDATTILKSISAQESGNTTTVNGANLTNSQIQTLFSTLNGTSTSSSFLQSKNNTSTNLETPFSTPNNTMIDYERTLLEAAIKNGEINDTTLSTIIEQQNKSGLIRSESKLMEWIQQNRPRTSEKETLNKIGILAADKLPYYGRYCGSFVEQISNSSKRFNVAGAVWAVDEHRLIISKFNFQPGSQTENITFWVGPAKPTLTAQDIFPTENGFYVKPEPVNIQAFMIQQYEERLAKIRPALPILARDTPTNNNYKTAEADEESDVDLGGENNKSLLNNQIRMKRNLYEDLYENKKNIVHFPIQFQTANSTGLHFTVNPSIMTPSPNLLANLANVTSPSIIPSTTIAPTTTTTRSTISFSVFGNPIVAHSKSPTTDLALQSNVIHSKNDPIVPLEWQAGFQPILLNLGEEKWIKHLNWISLYDHNKKQSIAFVLIPNGENFKVPSVVQLRPFTLNKAYNINSGPINVLDMKTIEIREFSLKTNGIPVWFMFGKEIMPNSNGRIMPIYDKESNTYDCESLRDYHNETVTLRLPGALDIKDVFWFSVFSITNSVSFASLYMPYNDMLLPPSLSTDMVPQCVWKKL